MSLEKLNTFFFLFFSVCILGPKWIIPYSSFRKCWPNRVVIPLQFKLAFFFRHYLGRVRLFWIFFFCYICRIIFWFDDHRSYDRFIAFSDHQQKNTMNAETDDTYISSWAQLLRPEVYKPFRLLMIYLFFANLLSGIQYGPFLVSIFTEFGAPVNVELTIVRIVREEWAEVTKRMVWTRHNWKQYFF